MESFLTATLHSVHGDHKRVPEPIMTLHQSMNNPNPKRAGSPSGKRQGRSASVGRRGQHADVVATPPAQVIYNS